MSFESIILNDSIIEMIVKQESFRSTVKSLLDLPVDRLKEAAVMLHTHMLSGGISSETMKSEYTKLVATLAAIEEKESKGKTRIR